MASRGFFGIGIFHGKTAANLGTLWRSAHLFGAAFVFTVGRRYKEQASDTTKASRHVPLFHYASLDDLVDHLPTGCPLVGIEQTPEAHELSSFVHPERACYLLGAEDSGLSGEAIRRCHRMVMVEGASRCLNVAVAGSIVLYDRTRKKARL